MSALEQRNKKQRAAPPQRDKRHAGEDTLDDDDATTPPALAVELRTDGYRVAAMLQPAPPVEAKRLRGATKPSEPPPAFGELQPYGTAAATALLSAIDKRFLPRCVCHAPAARRVAFLMSAPRAPLTLCLSELLLSGSLRFPAALRAAHDSFLFRRHLDQVVYRPAQLR